jgi:hypothetical protein
MRPLLCSPPAYPAFARLAWERQQMEHCLIRLLQALDMIVIELAGEPKEDPLAGCLLPPAVNGYPQCDPVAYQASGGLLTPRHMAVDNEEGQGG